MRLCQVPETETLKSWTATGKRVVFEKESGRTLAGRLNGVPEYPDELCWPVLSLLERPECSLSEGQRRDCADREEASQWRQ